MRFFKHFPFWTLGHVLTIIVISILFTFIVFKFILSRKTIKEGNKNFFLMTWSLIIIFLILELIFTFIPSSQGVRRRTYGSLLWKQYYWNPINSIGYRDNEINEKDTSKIKVFFLGDSFTAGAGTKNAEDRVSEQLNAFCENCTSYNLGQGGTDTKNEYLRLLAYPLKPDILILQYFGNDIDDAAKNNGVIFNYKLMPYNNIPGFTHFIVKKSCFINYFYWKFSREFPANNYADFVYKTYHNDTILREHLSDLDKITDHAVNNSIELYVIVYPMLNAEPEDSINTYVKIVSDHLVQKNIPVLNVSEVLKKMNIPVYNRVASITDPHPSVLLHETVAAELSELIKKNQERSSSDKKNKIIWKASSPE